MDNIKEIKEQIRILTDLVWDADKETSPQLLTPKGIKFWVGETSGKVHGLLFNDDKQMLSYCDEGCVFTVESNWTNDPARIQECLPLAPCKHENMATGDFFTSHATSKNIHAYWLLLPDGWAVNISQSECPQKSFVNKHADFLKVGK